MTLAITCPGCHAPFDVPEALRGKTIRCTTCATQIKVPAAAEPLPLDDEDDAPPARPAARKSPPAAPARPATAASSTRRPARARDEDDDFDDRPRRKAARSRDKGANPLTWVGIGVAALLLVGGAGAGIYYATKKSDTAGGGGGSGGDGWTAVAGAEGFAAEMPGTPNVTPLNQAVPGVGSMTGQQYEHKLPGNDAGYVVGYFTMPAQVAAATKANPGMFMNSSIQGLKSAALASKPGIRDAGESDVTLNGFPGRELKLAGANGSKGAGVVRLYLAGDRLYFLAAAGDDWKAGDERISRFVNSFQITYQPGGTAKPAGPKSPPTTPVAGAPPADDWQTVSTPNGFTAEMPGKPFTALGPDVPGAAREGVWQWTDRGGGGQVQVNVGVALFPREPARTLGQALTWQARTASRTWLPGVALTPGEPTDVTLGSFPGKQVVYAGGGKSAVLRVYAVGGKVFSVVAAGADLGPDSPRGRRFLDSFKITHAAPPGSASPPPVSPPAPVAAADDWVVVPDPIGFTAEMPRKAEHHVSAIRGFDHWYCEAFARESFRVEIVGLPGPDPAAGLDAAVQMKAKHITTFGSNGCGPFKAGEPTDVTLGTVRGKQVVFTSESGKHEGVVRMYPAGDRTYCVQVTGVGLGPESARAKRFLDSFKLTAAPVAGALDPTPGGPGPDMGFPGGGGKAAPLAARVEPFWAMAFDKEKSEAYTVGLRLVGTKGAGVLRRYSLPDFKLVNTYNLPAIATRAAVDGPRGVLYLSSVGAGGGGLLSQSTERIYADGSLQAFDLKAVRAGTAKEGDELKPLWAVQLAGGLAGFEPAADGKGVYALTVTTPKAGSKFGFRSRLAYVDVATKAVVQEKDLRFDGAFRDLSWSADGKTLLLTEWPLGPGGQILPPAIKSAAVAVIDPVGWAKVKPVPLPGLTTDVTDAPGGRLVAVVTGAGADLPGKLFTLDRDGDAKELKLPFGGAANPFYARFTPDGKRLVVSSVRDKGGVDIYDVTDAAAADGYKRVAAVRTADALPLHGYFHLTPDGTRAAFHTGAVIDLAEVAKGR